MPTLWKLRNHSGVGSAVVNRRTPHALRSTPSRSGRGYHTLRIAWQASLLIGCLLFASSGARSANVQVIGHVVGLNGDWEYYTDAAAENPAGKLRISAPVLSEGLIRIRSPSAYNYITIVNTQLQVIISKRCQPIQSCFQPIFLHDFITTQISVDDTLIALLSQAWASLFEDRYLESFHRERGASQFTEGVALIVDGQVDLGEVMLEIGEGKYSLSRSSYQNEATGLAREGGVEFDWDPKKPEIVAIGDRAPGLYEINSVEKSEELFRRQRILGEILLCTMPKYAQVVARFRTIHLSTDKWAGAVMPETIHAFLRAYLAELSKTSDPPER